VESSKATVTTSASGAEEASSKLTDVASSPIADNLASSSSSALASSSTTNISKIGANETPQEEKAMREKLLKSHSVSTGTSPPPQNISTQVSVYHLDKKRYYLRSKYSINKYEQINYLIDK